MVKKLILLLFLFSISAKSQTLEFGPTLGLHASSIDDSNFFSDQPSIGKKLWGINKGFQTVFYFKDPKVYSTFAILLNYNNAEYGVKSERRQNYYSYNTNSIELGFRHTGLPQNSGRLFLEAGLGINFFNTKDIYHGITPETTAFPELKEPILLTDKEFKLVLSLGYDFHISKNLVSFAELKASGGFTNITDNVGSYINTYFQINTGLRYLINLEKKEKNQM